MHSRKQRSGNEVSRLRGADYDPERFSLSSGDPERIIRVCYYRAAEAQPDRDREEESVHGTTPNA